jgi:serine phosphatase RsbU (regulator of sigma subunit)
MDTSSSLFGADRLARVVQELYDLPAREVVRGIREDIEGFVGGGSLSDDTTLVVCKII